MPRTAAIESAAPAVAGDAAAVGASRPNAPSAPPAGSMRLGPAAAESVGEGIADEVLVERLRRGDPAAGETLCKRYAQPLLRYLQRLAGEGMAEELHQQTWLSVLDNLEKFDPAAAGGGAGLGSGGFKSWLFRIATNKANDHWRSRGREKAAKQGLKLVTDEELPAADFRMEGSEQEVR